MFHSRFCNYFLVMRTNSAVGDFLDHIRHCFLEIFFGILCIVGMISTHLDPMIVGKTFIICLGVESLLLSHLSHEMDINKFVKIINEDVGSPNYGRSEVALNLGNEARLAWDWLIHGRALSRGVVGVSPNRQLLAVGLPVFAVFLSMSSIITERGIWFDMCKFGR